MGKASQIQKILANPNSLIKSTLSEVEFKINRFAGHAALNLEVDNLFSIPFSFVEIVESEPARVKKLKKIMTAYLKFKQELNSW